MLAKEVVESYAGRVAFVTENFGESRLAERFGVKRYPAVFVDDVLIAKPRDFGFFGEGESAGRYTPWRNAKNHEKFKQDLKRTIDLVAAGKKSQLRRERATDTASSAEIAELPKFSLTDLAGNPLTAEQLSGRVVVVEFWATWCPPCGSTLAWLGQIQEKYRDRVAVVALAVESQEAEVRKVVASLSPSIRWAMSTPEVARAFGDVVSVPTLFIFDGAGRTSTVIYGAPPDLHELAEKAINKNQTKAPTAK